jgi:hypothetical protein
MSRIRDLRQQDLFFRNCLKKNLTKTEYAVIIAWMTDAPGFKPASTVLASRLSAGTSKVDPRNVRRALASLVKKGVFSASDKYDYRDVPLFSANVSMFGKDQPTRLASASAIGDLQPEHLPARDLTPAEMTECDLFIERYCIEGTDQLLYRELYINDQWDLLTKDQREARMAAVAIQWGRANVS